MHSIESDDESVGFRVTIKRKKIWSDWKGLNVFIIFKLILIFILYWRIVDLQCYVSFRCKASDSVVHIHTSLTFRFFSQIGYYRVLSRVPWAI